MVLRAITGVFLILGSAFLFTIGGLPLRAAIYFLSLVGLYEYYRAFKNPIDSIHYIGLLFSLLYLAFMDLESNINPIFIILILFVSTLLIFMVKNHKEISIEDIAITIFGFLYIPLLLSTIWFVREGTYGRYLIWLIFICAWGSDTGAYCIGKLFGKRKLTPELSPNKTIEGSLGGILVAALLSLIFGLYVIDLLAIEMDTIKVSIIFIAIGIIGSIFAQLGDLAASTIKRHTGIKDFGRLFPGHGGVMDRFDSILFTAPAIYILTLLFSMD